MWELWKFNERSTRNCIHAIVGMTGRESIVTCSEGRSLGVGTASVRLSVVLSKGRSTSRACLLCNKFEHDVEAVD